MAGCDYKYCDKCDQKAYYDTDVDYGECVVVVLCKECAKKWLFVLVEMDIEELE